MVINGRSIFKRVERDAVYWWRCSVTELNNQIWTGSDLKIGSGVI